MTNPSTYPDRLLSQSAWLERLTRELVPGLHAADDLAQETLTAALERPEPARANVRTWLEGIARKLAADKTRARHRRLRRERRSARAEAQPGVADTLAKFEMHRSVVDAVQGLREPIRTTLLLRYWEDLPPREIAVRMNAPVETVRTRIKRGLHELRGRLDAQYGDQQAWCIPLLALATGQGAAAPASVAVSSLSTAASVGVFMQAKTVALVAIAVLGLSSVFVWNSVSPNEPGDPSSTDEPRVAATTRAESVVEPGQADAGDLALGDRTTVPDPSLSSSRWLTGRVLDEVSRPLANAELCFLTESQADRYRKYDARVLDPAAIQIARSRWTLWHASDRALMKKADLLGQLFGVERVTRTGSDGSFRIRRDAGKEQTVLALWSPVFGFRFHRVSSSVLRAKTDAADERVVFERWPRIHGALSLGTEAEKVVKITVDTGLPDTPRVLQFEANAPGSFVTPQIPPGQHRIELRTEDHHDARRVLDLAIDARINFKLLALPRLRLRLVDRAGAPWDAHRLATRGWRIDELRFLLLREDVQSASDLARDLRSHTALRYSPDTGLLEASVRDAEALVFSVWQGHERITAVRLLHHRVAELAIDFPSPKPATALGVEVSFANALEEAPDLDLQLGMMLGLGGYNFEPVTRVEGPQRRFELAVPGFLRGQACQLIVKAPGFATQILKPRIPIDGAPQDLWVTMLRAEHTLTGVVVDENEKPIRGIRLKISSAQGHAMRTLRESIGVTDERGEFRFTNLAEGSVRIFAAGPRFACTSVLTQVKRSEPLILRMLEGAEKRIEIAPAGEHGVMLRVLDRDGAPLLDDRIFGALHGGESTRVRLSRQARRVEVWRVGASKPESSVEF